MRGLNMEKFVASPLNYIGGKYKLLPQIIPLFPQNIDTFYDMFCGGCNVGVNINKSSFQVNKIIYNDNNHTLLRIIKQIKETPVDKFIKKVESIIQEYGLSNTKEYGYKMYECNSSSGLSSYNREPYLRLRNDVNNMKKTKEYYIKLYVLIVYSFNNQIRFNSQGNFNLPVGKRDFNINMENKLRRFHEALNSQESEFSSHSFSFYEPSGISDTSFVYCDPPYLITTAGYNENNGWNLDNEQKLLTYLSKLDELNIKFALSNVLTHKGKTNTLLNEWSKDFNIHHLNYNYDNSNYQTQRTADKTDEVLITNY